MLRRVVTGVSSTGKSIFVSDGPAETLGAGVLPPPGTVSIWAADSPPQAPSNGSALPHPRYFPPPGGFRVIVVELQPGTVNRFAKHDPAAIERELPGFVADAEWDPDQPGMHSTRTVDVGLVLDGSVHLELDSGATTELHAGDWYVQNGARHAWRNRSERACRLAIFLVGAAKP